ncbi:MAG: DoxX-like family protein [Candidatus Obscuribacterales bacterium]|nr:DoxX-like family protein [Candidatus Obscuribacterales bacterium]
MNAKLIFAFRIALASVWLYNGLWLKLIVSDGQHLSIVQSVFTNASVDPLLVLKLIGSCETLLAIGIMSGLCYRFISIFQIVVIVSMNIAGILFGGGAIEHPVGLIVSNLPTIMCALAVAMHGPGWASLAWKKNE